MAHSLVYVTANKTGEPCTDPICPHVHTWEKGAPPIGTKETAVADKGKATIPDPVRGIIRGK